MVRVTSNKRSCWIRAGEDDAFISWLDGRTHTRTVELTLPDVTTNNAPFDLSTLSLHRRTMWAPGDPGAAQDPDTHPFAPDGSIRDPLHLLKHTAGFLHGLRSSRRSSWADPDLARETLPCVLQEIFDDPGGLIAVISSDAARRLQGKDPQGRTGVVYLLASASGGPPRRKNRLGHHTPWFTIVDTCHPRPRCAPGCKQPACPERPYLRTLQPYYRDPDRLNERGPGDRKPSPHEVFYPAVSADLPWSVISGRVSGFYQLAPHQWQDHGAVRALVRAPTTWTTGQIADIRVERPYDRPVSGHYLMTSRDQSGWPTHVRYYAPGNLWVRA